MMNIFSSNMKKAEAASPAAARVTPAAPVVSTQQLHLFLYYKQ